MTRYTNIGIKRTYFQAGFKETPGSDAGPSSATAKDLPDSVAEASNSGSAPEGKRRKGGKRAKLSPNEETDAGKSDNAEIGAQVDGGAKGNRAGRSDNAKRVNASGYLKRKQARGDSNQSASEQRRLQRIQERLANTTCFACREKGHAAKDCPTAKEQQAGQGEGEHTEGNGQQRQKKTAPLTGICYRCGSKKHSLSKCRKPEDSSNPLPFASCYVCSGRGHIASKCPQNVAKGVYPNGGCCKLCGETSHLARDCDLRNQDKQRNTVILGTGNAVGPDEDDFHVLRRTTTQMDQDEKSALKLSKKLAKAAAMTEKRLPTRPDTPAAKKVVVF